MKKRSTKSKSVGDSKAYESFPINLDDNVFINKSKTSVKPKESFLKKKFTPKNMVNKRSGEVA